MKGVVASLPLFERLDGFLFVWLVECLLVAIVALALRLFLLFLIVLQPQKGLMPIPLPVSLKCIALCVVLFFFLCVLRLKASKQMKRGKD